jgi:transposase
MKVDAKNKMINLLREKYEIVKDSLDERGRRLWATSEAKAIGYGGQSIVSEAIGLSRRTIFSGIKELGRCEMVDLSPLGSRRKGGGRKELNSCHPELLKNLESLVESTTRGDPESPLKWTCKSVRELSAELKNRGFEIGRQKVAHYLSELGYSLQSARKTKEGNSHPDRNAQFEYINARVKNFQNQGQPVISVDAKKKELVGDFKNNGKEWRKKGKPELVRVYDFIDKQLGKVTPYGVYDQTANVGWVSVGIDHDTAEFAVESIRRWWLKMGKSQYPVAFKLLITADGGGSNGSRNRLWKVALQNFSDETGLEISVSHFPPATSKWNKIEHRMFSYISMNWRGKPLVSHETIVNLISNTTTKKGLKIQAEIDENSYPTGIKVTDQQLAELQLKKDLFHGKWNYTITPNTPDETKR